MQNFSITSWNTQRELNYTGYTSLNKFKSYVKTFNTDIIALQEMCSAEEVLKNIPELKIYNVFIPKINKSPTNRVPGYNYNVILSKYPILRANEITFPIFNKKRILQNCTRVEIQLENKILILYNCQLPIFKAGIATRLKQLQFLLSDAKKYGNVPIIICGDMNVTIPKVGWSRKIISGYHQKPKREMFVDGKFINYDERKLFNTTINQYGFKEALDLYTPTWSPFKSKKWEMFKLKLDWFIVKNLEVMSIESAFTFESEHL